jgi:multicomponent Na+:H+ antiporter subunit D
MSWLVPLPVAIPLVGAALVAATDHLVPARLKDYPAMVVGATSSVFSAMLLLDSQGRDLLQWQGGWTPRHGVAIGIALVADPLGAGMAAFASVVVTAALVYSWHYMEESPRLHRVLMLVFLAGVSGFALSGDLFNMFVWFELSAVATYALAGYMVEELGPLQGAINYAITNSIAGFMILFGTALVYGRTGALNLAQIGESLSRHSADGLVIVAFTLVVGGFFVKSALAPFHLWLADTYAVAPAPVCFVFAAVMSELGLFGIARVYWTAFEGAFTAHADAVTGLFVGVGLVTAVLGAVMAFLQRHLKRLLAYTVVAHVGVALVGIAFLNAKGLAGAAELVTAHGFLKGALFLGAGVLLRAFGDVDELRLHGKGRAVPALGFLLALAAAGLVGVPYVGTFLGHSSLDEAAVERGFGWVRPVVALATAVSMAAVLRATARICFGWGTREDPLLSEQPPEEPPDEQANQPLMLTVIGILVAFGLALGVMPGMQSRAEHAAERFRDRQAYVEQVLAGKRRVHEVPPAVLHAAKVPSLLYGVGAFAVMLAVAAFGLYRTRLPAPLRRRAARVFDPPVAVLKSFHSGIAADYVVWLTVGTAVVGGIWTLTLR